jgi:hypothetical protein
MVVVQVQGGLGNQLFQVAAGYWLARHNDETKLYLDASRVSFGTDSSRRLEVLNFKLFSSDFTVDVWGERFKLLQKVGPLQLTSLAAVTASRINTRFRFRDHFYYLESESTIGFDNLEAKSILNGYFNNFSIVEKAHSVGLANRLELAKQPSRWLLETLKSINFDSSIALHLRLGDYLRFPQIFGHLSEEYYLAGLEEIGFAENHQIVIFSDQPNLAANHLPKISSLKNCSIVRQPSEVPSYETLFLMSQFKNIVCANSTFSMWAAWFNQGVGPAEKRVVIPTPYLLDRADMVTPASWHKIPRG